MFSKAFFQTAVIWVWLLVPVSAFAAFGLTTATDYYTVDTGAGLVFKVRRTDNGSSTQSAGDLMSLVYNGVEYQDQSRGSQVNSGFDYLYSGVSAVTVSAAVVNTNYVKVTVVAGNLTHYYLARSGYPHIYMATYFTTEPDTLGLCRYIVRIPSNLLTNGPPPSDIRNNTGAVESSDIFGLADGTTRSKHYSNMRLKDWSYIGATGNKVGVWMVRDNNEGNSGGPFYRCLLNQCGDDQEITYIVNYGEEQTEAFRTSILDAYTLVFTTGSAPGTVDTSWFANMGLTGYVSAVNRGAVTCPGMTGLDTSYPYTVGFANSTAQYWTDAAKSNGAFTMAGMIPGTYTLSVYKNELAVYSGSVTVAAGGTATLDPITINADPSATVPLWRIGNWDGTPNEFLNADKVTTMHPSDVRITPAGSYSGWNPGTYVVGASSPATGVPCYQWKDVNGTQTVQFNLTASQLVASTVRVGITVAYSGARPKISVNSWQPANPAASTQPDTRTLTVGSYRGNNTTYTFSVPASAFVTGTNTLTFFPISGSGSTGYLSAGYSLDCVDIYQGNPVTLAVPAAPGNLVGARGDGKAALSWTAVPGAATYTVGRALVSGGPYTVVASGLTTPSYTDTGLTNGTTYYYLVSASNTSGTGVNSSQIAVVPAASSSAYVAYLKFDETGGTTAADASGNGWNGSLTGGAAFVAGGKSNDALSLTGGGYATLPTGVVGSLHDFTICAWVKPNTVANWMRIFDFGTGTNAYMFLTPLAPGTNAARFGFTANGNGNEQQINASSALAAGVWTHVVVTLSGSVGTLYLNGVASGTNSALTLTPSALGSTTLNYLGRSQFTGDPPLDGLVDEFQVYDHALSAAQVAAIAQPPAAPTGFRATVGDAQAALAWNAVPNATSYTVRRGTVSGQENTVVGSGITALTFTDTGLANGATYYYTVTAASIAGTGAGSPEIAVVPAQSFSQWIAAAFPGQTNPLIIGAHADPDGDGLSNALEYFLGTNPAAANGASALTCARNGTTQLVASFRMSKNLAGVTYSIQQSSDLSAWTDTGVQGTIVSDQGSYYNLAAGVPLNGQSRLYLRLVVTIP